MKRQVSCFLVNIEFSTPFLDGVGRVSIIEEGRSLLFNPINELRQFSPPPLQKITVPQNGTIWMPTPFPEQERMHERVEDYLFLVLLKTAPMTLC